MSLKRYINTAINNPFAALFALFYRARRLLPLDYMFGNGLSFPPEMVIVLPTNRCNFTCAHCAARAHSSSPGNGELSTSEFKTVFDKLATFMPSIYFSGGEPFLRKDIFELISYVKEKKMVMGAVTNGSFFTDDLVRKIIESGIDFLGVSIDGPKDYHSEARGYPEAYSSVVEGLRKLISLRAKLKARHPLLKITCIIDGNNVEHAYHVLKLANDIGVDQVDFGFRMFYLPDIERKQADFIQKYNVGGMAIIGQRLETVSGQGKDIARLKKFSKEARSLSKIPVSIYEIRGSFEDFYSSKVPSAGSVCKGGWFNIVINPDGSVEPCQGFKLGSILQDDFFSLWNGKKMQSFRRLRKKQTFPACFRCIEGQELRFD